MTEFYTINTIHGKTLYEGFFYTYAQCVESALNHEIPLKVANFRGRNLQNVMLDDASITYADFRSANLTGANLSETDFTGCNFSDAALFNTCFAYSTLNNCIFNHANFGGTIIAGADLSGSRFTGLSCLDLNFIEAESLQNCLYVTPNNRAKRFFVPPIVIKGYGEPIIIVDSEKH